MPYYSYGGDLIPAPRANSDSRFSMSSWLPILLFQTETTLSKGKGTKTGGRTQLKLLRVTCSVLANGIVN